ncbi:thiol reductant ABC exporter subunit CydD [Nocardioides pantholopis]|uniref:thiol reductant ABC exporter subunit CydD n=1 Tax=Nocardioides pantholopis TaxID=2483798 RepID=UPI000FDABE9F|nr:thiol reductant ABC exporter subunit CydD [Nocardioides pantholopis]
MRPTDPRLRAQLAPARRPLAGVLAAGVLGALLIIAQAWAVTGLVVAAVRREDLGGWAVAVAAVFAARALTGWAGDVLAARAAAQVGTSLRRQVVRAVLRRREVRSADAVLLTRGVSAAEPYLTRYLPAVVLAGALPVLTLAAMAWLDWLSALIVLLTLPLVPVFGALVGLATRDRAEEQWRAMASLSGHFLDVVRGLPTLVAYRRARAQSDTIARVTDRYRRASMQTLRLAFASSAVLELVATLSVALVAVTVGIRLAGGGLDLDTALLVLLLAPEAYWPLRRVGAEFHAAAEGVATFEQVHELVTGTPQEPADRPVAAPGTGDGLVLAGLTVVHPGRTVPALDGVDAVLPARGVTVITGPSGCGKSTLLGAVAGLVPRTAGLVLLDGTEVDGPAWREQVAWVSQRPVFVAGSIADNLRLAAPDATADALWSALRRVALEERVRDLPAGLDSALGEDGAGLSAGERARLALARVVLADRPWVLLDEPTAHLDDLTERVIADTVVELGRDRAVVVVAHRPALVALADSVVELAAPVAAAAPAPAPSAVSLPPSADPKAWPAHRSPADAGQTDDTPADRLGLGISAVLGALASLAGVALTATAGWLIVQSSTHPPVLTLMVAIVGVRTFGLARPALRYVERLRSHDVALRLLARRRVEVYDAVVPLVPARLGRRRGDLLASVVDDVDSVVDDALRVRLPLRSAALVAVLATLAAALLLPVAGAVVAATCVLGGGLALGLARLGGRSAERAAVAHRADLSAAAVEVAQVAPELVMWQAEESAVSRVATLSDRLGRDSVRAGAWLGAARAIVLLVCGAGVAVMARLGAPALADGAVSGPVLALLVLLPLALADTLTTVADAGVLAARTRAASERLTALERTEPAVRTTVARPLPTASDLDVAGVSASWSADPAAPPALQDLSLRVDAGDRVGVVGPSGSGKSTLAALLLRFLDPVSGTVRLGGTASVELDPDDVRRVVGLVDDDPHVFATTLVENVRLARPDASDADVEDALRRARLGAWLDALPAGLDTWLGDGHAQVSGGERARIAIARSMLADHPVLVLDEPTAHLDHATATELATELLTGPRRRSLLWITHDSVGLDLLDRHVDLGEPAGLLTEAR